jgi:hypothetical protein
MATATVERKARIGLARQKFARFCILRPSYLKVYVSGLFYLEGAWLTMEFPTPASARCDPDFSEHRHLLSASLFSNRCNFEVGRRVREMHRQGSQCSPMGVRWDQAQ